MFPQLAYRHYGQAPLLAQALWKDAALRFATIHNQDSCFSNTLARVVMDWIEQVEELRNVARF